MKNTAGPELPDDAVGGEAGEVVAARMSLRILVFCLSVLILGKLKRTSIGGVIGIGLVARIVTAACTSIFDKLLIVLLSALDAGRVIFHGTQNGSFALMPRVIFFATTPTFVGLATATSISSESGLSLARVGTNLLPAIGHQEEALANQRASNVLDLVNLILSSLSGPKDDGQLLPLVHSIEVVSGRVSRVQATEGRKKWIT